ncbi:hypothetical protein [Haloferula sp.]|uniref:hypothetical protein n=1 Tax=Haloferula sp. TaxID=2497595 RepID=UPI00329C1CA3
MLTYILKWGYREAREDRLSEWTILRERGYFQTLIRRYGLLFVVVGVVSIWPDREAGETILASFQDSFRFLVSFFLIFLAVDYFIWRATEKEWKAWKEEKENKPNKSQHPTA